MEGEGRLEGTDRNSRTSHVQSRAKTAHPSVEAVESPLAAFRGRTVFIVRHAQGQHNVSSQFEFDPPLTDTGLKQVLCAFARACPEGGIADVPCL